MLQTAWAIALAGALGWGLHAGHQVGPAVGGRMLSSVLLVVAAGVAWRLSGGRMMAWITAGVGLGTVGDFANAGLLGALSGTLVAMGAFGLGHLCYVTGLLGALRERGARLPATALAVVVWWLLGALGWYLVVLLAPEHELAWPALAYTLLLAATAGFATALAVTDRRFVLLAAGAALFLLSDLILAVELFRGRFVQDTLAVWVPYGVGQMLIVFTSARQVESSLLPRVSA